MTGNSIRSENRFKIPDIFNSHKGNFCYHQSLVENYDYHFWTDGDY